MTTKPEIDPPAGCMWCDCPRCGDWKESKSWNTGITEEWDDTNATLGWFRWALELDGHEDCCHHQTPVWEARTETP